MKITDTEVYEDNAGTLYLFAMAGDKPVWGATYYESSADGMTGPEMCAADYVGLVVQGIDPVADGWEGVENPADLYDEMTDFDDDLIADCDGVYDSQCGIAGKQFAAAIQD